MSSRTSLRFMFFIVVVFLFAWSARPPGASWKRDLMAGTNAASPAQVSPQHGDTPVLVELFTSEGCSSCPPADALLSRLWRTQPVRGADVIILEEHVDYWDRLGWKDPFSLAEMSARQADYAGAFSGAEVYTPQMVVDGRAEFVGSSENDALRAVREAAAIPKATLALSWTPDNRLSIAIPPLANRAQGDSAEVFSAVSESRIQSEVKRGENSGLALKHDGVARRISLIGKIENGDAAFSTTISIPPSPQWNRANSHVIVFVQARRGRRILAVAEVPFPS